jgi:hypothetical protein
MVTPQSSRHSLSYFAFKVRFVKASTWTIAILVAESESPALLANL